MMEHVSRRKTHKKKTKRTVVEEEDLPLPLEQGVSVAYISNSHTVSPESTIGMLVVNFLAKNRRPVTANVVYHDHTGEYHSLYNIDLNATLAESGIGPNVLLAFSGFETEAEARESVAMLANYLSTYRGSMPYEDRELLNEARAYIESRSRPPVVTKIVSPIRQQREVIRDSVDSVPRNGARLPSIRAPASPRTRRRVVEEIEEETDTESSTTEEEVITTRRAIRR